MLSYLQLELFFKLYFIPVKRLMYICVNSLKKFFLHTHNDSKKATINGLYVYVIKTMNGQRNYFSSHSSFLAMR